MLKIYSLSSPTRDRTVAPCSGEHGVLTTGPPGMFLNIKFSFISCSCRLSENILLDLYLRCHFFFFSH